MTEQLQATRRPTAVLTAVSGMLLAAVGATGFFYSSDFAAPGRTAGLLGAIAVNGWTNLLHVLTAVAALVVTAAATRTYALVLAVGYLAIAAWGAALGAHEPLAGFIARNGGTDILHAAVGFAAIGALVLERRRSAAW